MKTVGRGRGPQVCDGPCFWCVHVKISDQGGYKLFIDRDVAEHFLANVVSKEAGSMILLIFPMFWVLW